MTVWNRVAVLVCSMVAFGIHGMVFAEDGGVTISGTVSDASGNIQGALVFVKSGAEERPLLTGKDGTYSINIQANKEIDISFSHGTRGRNFVMGLSENHSHQFHIRLHPIGAVGDVGDYAKQVTVLRQSYDFARDLKSESEASKYVSDLNRDFETATQYWYKWVGSTKVEKAKEMVGNDSQGIEMLKELLTSP